MDDDLRTQARVAAERAGITVTYYSPLARREMYTLQYEQFERAYIARAQEGDEMVLCVCTIGHPAVGCTNYAPRWSPVCDACESTACSECRFRHGLHNEGTCGQWRDEEPERGATTMQRPLWQRAQTQVNARIALYRELEDAPMDALVQRLEDATPAGQTWTASTNRLDLVEQIIDRAYPMPRR